MLLLKRDRDKIGNNKKVVWACPQDLSVSDNFKPCDLYRYMYKSD